MPAYLVPLIGALVIGILGVAIGYFLRKSLAEGKLNHAEELAKNIIIDAEREAENNKRDILFQAKEEIHKLRDDKEIIIKFFQSAITDLVIRWLTSGMDEDIEKKIKRIGFLLKDTVKSSLTRSKMN